MDAESEEFDDHRSGSAPPKEHAPPVMTHRRRLARNAAAGGLANILKIAVQLLMLPVMAHLLGPAEFGLYALALPTVSFFMTLADGGLGVSLAREDESATAVWSSAVWTLLLVGMALALIVSVSGVALADFSREPRLAALMAFLSLGFILITASVAPTARLTRRGQLGMLAATDAASTLVGAAIAVTLAIEGAGAWSLAAQYVAGLGVRAIALNTVAFVKPTGGFRLALLRPHLSVGGAVLGTRLVDFGGRLAENLLFGRIFGVAALGNYTFANQAPRFMCEAVSGPLWGALYAHALVEDPAKVAVLHERLVHVLASMVFPAAFLLSASAQETLGFMLGAKWSAAAGLLAILLPGYAINVVAAQSGAILLANNRGGELWRSCVALAVGRVAAVASGLWLGGNAVAWGITLSNLLFSLYLFGAPARAVGAGVAPVLRAVAAPLVASAIAAAACKLALGLQSASLGWTIVVFASCGMLVYLPLLTLLDGGRLLREARTLSRIAFRQGEAV